MSKKKDSLKPWLSRPAVNRSVTLPLTRPLTQRLSNLNEFHPNELDPYLLFDAQSSMLGTLEASTLDLDPSDPSTLEVITATRAGTATYTDASGNIATAPSDTVRVDHTQGAELTPTKFQRVSNTDYFSSPNFAENTTLQYVTGPTGELDAVRVTEDATTDYHYLAMRADVVSGTTYAISFYIKQGSYPTARVFTQSLYMVKNTTVNFSTETASGGGIMENVGDGWYRVTFTGTSNLTGTMIVYATVTNLNSYAGDVNNFTDYYGFQVEEGTTATDFVANTTGSPKFISSAVYSDRVAMVLIEPSATNLVTYSEDFSNSYWTKSGSSVVSGQTSPSGDTSAFKLVEDTSSGEHKVSTGIITVSAGTTDTYSVFVKKAGRTKIAIREEQHGGKYVSFNLLSKTVISNTGLTANIIEFSDDWLRIDYSQNSGGGLEKFSLFLLDDAYTSGSPTSHSYTGDGTSGVYIWGAQLETGSVATSYIPTSGGSSAARTRSADDLVISGSAFTDFYNQSEGTFYFEGVPQNLTDDTIYWMDMSPSNERIAIYDGPSYNVRFFVENIESVSAPYYPPNQLARLAISFKSNAQELSVNGGTSVTLTNNSLPSPTSLHIGSRYSLGNHLNGHIKRLIYWPTHSDNL